jgi:hypothetical protein
MCWHFRRVRVRTDGRTFGGPPIPPQTICDASIWPSTSGSVSLTTDSEDFPTRGFPGLDAATAISECQAGLAGEAAQLTRPMILLDWRSAAHLAEGHPRAFKIALPKAKKPNVPAAVVQRFHGHRLDAPCRSRFGGAR